MQSAIRFALVLGVAAAADCASTAKPDASTTTPPVSTAKPSSSTAKPLSPEEKAVVAPLQGVLDGLAARDRNMIAAQLLPGGSATLMRKDEPVQMPFDVFAERLSAPGTGTREERIYDPIVQQIPRPPGSLTTPGLNSTPGEVHSQTASYRTAWSVGETKLAPSWRLPSMLMRSMHL